MVCYHNQEEVCHDTSQPAVKLVAKNLQSACKVADSWLFETETALNRRPIQFKTAWLQGFIESMTNINCFTLKDHTGSVKVNSCDCVPGDKSWINEGVYCSVVGTLMKAGDVPEIATLKMADLSNNMAHQELWGLEVRELQFVLSHDVKLQK